MVDIGKYQKFFDSHFNENWLSYENFEDYFSSTICSLSPDDFFREAQKWDEEQTRLLNEQKNLAFKNYSSFISTSECSKEIRGSFDEIENRLENVSDLIPELQAAMNKCSEVASQSSIRRKEVNVSITKHPQLLEVLELPQLIDTSIRNNFFDEGLELHSFVTNLALKYSDIEIIQSIKRDADECIHGMEEVLLKQLQSQINLTKCLKNVGLLRRIGTYSELQLKTKFLHLRTHWFKSVINAIPKDDIQYFMCKMIDTYRVNLFDIITQYRSIFIEEKNNSLNFNSWLHRQVRDFVVLLSEHLPACNGAVLDSVIAQSMYFGMSLGRVGADFRGVLVPVFQKKVLQMCTDKIQSATTQFLQQTADIMEIKNRSTGDLKLIKLTPLASYTNSLLAMLNELRHCSPSNLNPVIISHVQQSLETVAEAIVEILSQDKTFSEDVCNCVVVEMMPLLNSATLALFSSLPLIYKQSSSQFSCTEKLMTSLDVKKLENILDEYTSKTTKILLGNVEIDSNANVETSDVSHVDVVNDNDTVNMDTTGDNIENEKVPVVPEGITEVLAEGAVCNDNENPEMAPDDTNSTGPSTVINNEGSNNDVTDIDN